MRKMYSEYGFCPRCGAEMAGIMGDGRVCPAVDSEGHAWLPHRYSEIDGHEIEREKMDHGEKLISKINSDFIEYWIFEQGEFAGTLLVEYWTGKQIGCTSRSISYEEYIRLGKWEYFQESRHLDLQLEKPRELRLSTTSRVYQKNKIYTGVHSTENQVFVLRVREREHTEIVDEKFHVFIGVRTTSNPGGKHNE